MSEDYLILAGLCLGVIWVFREPAVVESIVEFAQEFTGWVLILAIFLGLRELIIRLSGRKKPDPLLGRTPAPEVASELQKPPIDPHQNVSTQGLVLVMLMREPLTLERVAARLAEEKRVVLADRLKLHMDHMERQGLVERWEDSSSPDQLEKYHLTGAGELTAALLLQAIESQKGVIR